MATISDIDAYLARAGLPFERIGQSADDGSATWMINDPTSAEQVVVRLSAPLVLFRCKIMNEPEKRNIDLYQALLELNTRDLVHGAYGLSDTGVTLTCALQSQNLDFNEFQAVIDDFSLAFTNHYPILDKFRNH